MSFPAVVSASVLALVVLLVPVFAFPVSHVGDAESSDAQKSFEVIGGPREFYVPLAPPGDTALPRSVSGMPREVISSIPKSTDLEYIVYGKLYLIKALKRPDKSLGSSFRWGETAESHYKLHENQPYIVDERSESKKRYNDGITFPIVAKRTQRTYKSRNSLLPHDQNQNQGSIIEGAGGYFGHRKIEERSAEQINDSKLEIPARNITKAVSDNPKTDENFDEEELELIQEHIANQPKSEIGEINNDTDTFRDSNSTVDKKIDIGNRFLINVPNKPVSTQCPEGERRTHFGVCKPISVHRPSPSDGFFEGKIIAANNSQRKEQNVSFRNDPREEIPNLHLTTLFRSVVQLERKLEKAIKETERQLLANARILDDRGTSKDATEEA